MNPLAVVWLGRVGYRAAAELQERLRRRILDGDDGAETLLLLEHDPVITLGRAARPEHVLVAPDELRARGVAVERSSRGGDVTYHGPGQLVAYPVLRLARGVLPHVRAMADAAIEVARVHGVAAEFRRDCPGVWVSGGAVGGSELGGSELGGRELDGGELDGSELGGRELGGGELDGSVKGGANGSCGGAGGAKLAAFGVHVHRRVAIHGVALNVSTALDAFDLIVPCGLSGTRATSLAALTGRPLTPAALWPAFAAAFARAVGRRPVDAPTPEEAIAIRPLLSRSAPVE